MKTITALERSCANCTHGTVVPASAQREAYVQCNVFAALVYIHRAERMAQECKFFHSTLQM